MVRIANDKFLRDNKLTGGARAKTITEAFELLVEENLSLGSRAAEWQGFRENSLWCVEVNDILDANLEFLRRVYKPDNSPASYLMSLDEAVGLLTKTENIGFNERDAVYCYGMSKMTIADENGESRRYESIQFVEFLEMVCRAADTKFQGSELASLPLAHKVGHILDDIFAPFNFRRRGVHVEITEETDSDSDY